MRKIGWTVPLAIMLLVVLADTVLAAHWPADGSPRRIHGTDLVFFLLVAFWPIQVGVALLVYWYAGQRGIVSRLRWLVLVAIPAIGWIIALAYVVFTRMDNRKGTRSSDGRQYRIPREPARAEVRR